MNFPGVAKGFSTWFDLIDSHSEQVKTKLISFDENSISFPLKSVSSRQHVWQPQWVCLESQMDFLSVLSVPLERDQFFLVFCTASLCSWDCWNYFQSTEKGRPMVILEQNPQRVPMKDVRFWYWEWEAHMRSTFRLETQWWCVANCACIQTISHMWIYIASEF